jgi:hypothetical protein
MRASTTNLDHAPVWWLHPGRLLLLFMLPLYLFIVCAIPLLWPSLIVLSYGSFLDARSVVLGGACLLITGLCSELGSRIDLSRRRPQSVYEVNERFLGVLGAITIGAYLIWFGPAAARGEFFLARDELNRMPGVTSFTQCGVTFVACYVYATLKARQRLSSRTRLMFYAILVLTAARVFIWSERLALIEIGSPIVIGVFAYAEPRRRWQRLGSRFIGTCGPFLAIPALLGFFTMTEVFRSWSSDYYQSKNIALGEFMVSRLATYYYTALNNGAGLLATTRWPSYYFVYILSWFYKLPLGIGGAFASALPRDAFPSQAFLSKYADPEFTNMSGLFPIIYDVGIWGGLTYFGVLGLLAGMTFRSLRTGRRLGILFYSSVFLACLEILRIGYLNESRCFLVVVSALAAAAQMRPQRAAHAPAQAPRSVRVLADEPLPQRHG